MANEAFQRFGAMMERKIADLRVEIEELERQLIQKKAYLHGMMDAVSMGKREATEKGVAEK